MKKLRILITQVFGYGYKKYLLIMKLTTLLCFLTLLPISASIFSQSTSLSLKVNNKTIKEVLEQIEQESKFHFLYNDNYVDLDKKVDLEVNKMNIHDILDQLLKGSSSSYKVLDNNLVVIAPVEIMQQQKVTGKVLDATSGEPIIGANVIIQGTTIGTTTDIDGKFSLDVTNANAVLVISSVGYMSETVNVNGQSMINVKLAIDITKLEEVVVIGYGSVRKSDLTGSVGSIKETELKNAKVNSIDQILQGRAAGVQVTQASNAPGGGISVRIRGNNSIQGGNDPLYVIDGLPIYNNESVNSSAMNPLFSNLQQPNILSTINPNDIQSIEVLKDASATAIYGARGSNGVVLITTKKGESGKVKVQVDASNGVGNVAKTYDLLNARQFAEYNNNARANSSPALPTYFDLNNLPPYDIDYQKEIFQTSKIQDYQLSLTGGDQTLLYAITAGYHNESGIVKSSGFERYSLRANLEKKANKWLKVGNNLAISRSESEIANTDNQYGYNLIMSSLQYVPLQQKMDQYGVYSSGQITGAGIPLIVNPGYITDLTKMSYTSNKIIGNIYAEVTPVKELTWRIAFGSDIQESRNRNFQPLNGGNASNAAQSIVGTISNFYWNLENLLTYNKSFGKSNVTTMVGATQEQYVSEASSLYGENLSNKTDVYNNFNGNTRVTNNMYSSYLPWQMASFFGRLNYSYDGKYLFTASLRRDGSSRFGKDMRWGTFPSVALAWTINKENFMQSFPVISTLKLRGSYGETGSTEIGTYNSLSTYGGSNAVWNNLVAPGYATNRIPNPYLQWESTKQSNIGLDLAVLDGRIAATIDLYKKRTESLLYNLPIPASTGFTTMLSNVGNVENKGIEMGLSTFNLTGEFKWNTSFMVSFNRNEVIKLDGQKKEAVLGNVQIIGQPIQILRVGEPIGSFYGYKTDGVYTTKDPINPATNKFYNQPNSLPGDIKYQDITGANGVRDSVINSLDRVILGNANPDYVFSFSNSFSYKGFDLNVFIQGVQGNEIMNLTRATLENFSGTTNTTTRALDRWTTTNETVGQRKAMQAGRAAYGNATTSDLYVEDGSYIRLKTLTLAYNFPSSLVSKMRISNLRIYCSANNVYTWTNYSGYDPDINSAGKATLNTGYEYGAYPSAKVYTVGLNITF